jgi:hypothetical protein
MAESLNSMLAEYRCDGHERADIYFWPGYDSILSVPGELGRLMLKNSTDGHDGGIGFKSRSSSSPYRDSLSLFAFQKLLQDYPDDWIEGGYRFRPGGTHAWVSDAALMLPGERPLNVIAIETGGAGSQEPGRQGEPDSANGVFRIHLDLHSFADWGNRLASILNDGTRLPSLRQPGTAMPFRPLWPYHRDDKAGGLSPHEVSIVHAVRKDLYCFWLAANLDTSPTYDGPVHLTGFDIWVEGLISRLNKVGLKHLAGRITSVGRAGTEFAGHCYRYWYTFNLERTVSPCLSAPISTPSPDQQAEGSELGSLMILSSHHIPHEFFFLAKPWVERVYGWMRAVESAILTARAGAEGQSHEFVHQVAGLIDEVLYDEGTSSLSPSAQNAAWQMQALVRVWSSKDFQPQRFVFESNEQFWQTFRHDSDGQFLDYLIDQALRHTFRRAALPPDPGDSVGLSVQEFVLQNYEHPEEARKRLEISISGLPPRWVKTNGFIVAFHHCLWQAAQHALRASFNAASQMRPYLWLTCRADEVLIYNRSEKPRLDRIPKDWRFFTRLAERMKDTFGVETRFDDLERAVVTRIVFRVRI